MSPRPDDPTARAPAGAAAGLTIGALALLGVASVLGPRGSAWVLLFLAAGASVIAWVVRRAPPRPLRAIPVLAGALPVAMATGLLWQPAMALALGLHAATAWASRGVIPPPELGPRGRLPAWATLAVGGVTPLGLLGWLAVARPDLSGVVQAYVPSLPLATLILGGAVVAVVNATLEEIVWRGVFQRGLEAALGPALAIGVQAVSFGVAHAHGVPSGWLGVVLAGAWALLLGLLRRASGGLLAPIVAHFVADATIAVIVLGSGSALG